MRSTDAPPTWAAGMARKTTARVRFRKPARRADRVGVVTEMGDGHMYSALMVDVSGSVALDGSHRLSAWVFPPEHVDGPVPLLFCLPGGSYTKAYWHLEVPGRPGYSFAEHLARAGMLVVAVDHLGVGESSRHSRAIDLTPEVIAAATRRRSTWSPTGPPAEFSPSVFRRSRSGRR